MDEENFYPVYLLQENVAFPDPFFNEKRYHTGIFIETDPQSGTGAFHHVTGDIVSVQGMKYEVRPMSSPPESSEAFHAKTKLGRVRREDYPATFDEKLRGIPPPIRQRIFNPRTMTLEQCKLDGTLYMPGESKPPYEKCTEWTNLKAIPALIEARILIES
ncbi:uncharacterized protein GIQ15_02818 [Arthroderma uncinatum]|uniref:uncharacterized protein n=1 Tax=Arthroderma uncinatum TaxID=74035 RepID=UPI00144AD4A2|nr:uncharacterized protein GIQ15_02818 [Arthroderma uncinatum]KAF3483494.1 hypothetical protein GIQ15_02818 [Arthroderma uncinatum]